MKSEHHEKFNHDPWAARYDKNVANEQNPIRAGYQAVLKAVARLCPDFPGARILELGIGAGNLTQMLNLAVEVTGLDISRDMMALAAKKLTNRPNIQFVVEDVLAYLHRPHDPLDGIISTYTIHHLTAEEKGILFSQCWHHFEVNSRQFSDLSWVFAAQKPAFREN